MIGNNIKNFRIKQNIIEKELAEKLNITEELLIKWENNEEIIPDDKLESIAEILNISVSELTKEEEKIDNKNDESVVDENTDDKNDENIDEKVDSELLQKKAKKRVICSYWISGVVAVLLAAGSITLGIVLEKIGLLFILLGYSALSFTFISCWILNNNFIGRMTVDVFLFGFIKMPKAVFSVNINRAVWLIIIKILFFICDIIISILFMATTLILGLILSVFIYPFALNKMLKITK